MKLPPISSSSSGARWGIRSPLRPSDVRTIVAVDGTRKTFALGENESVIRSAARRHMLPHGLPFERQAEHIMSMPAAQRRWTSREVRELIAENPLQTPRYELVDGELLVTSSPTPQHQRAIQRLSRALDAYLQRNSIGEAGRHRSTSSSNPTRSRSPTCSCFQRMKSVDFSWKGYRRAGFFLL